MLGNFNINPTIPASDLERARAFYAEKLELTPVRETAAGLYYEVGTSMFLLYPTQFAGTAQHTVASWEVDDLEAVVAHLRARGVVFEEYDYPELKTINGIATFGAERAAWFRDSEGNILAIGDARG